MTTDPDPDELLDALDEADQALRALYLRLADDPELEHDVELRERRAHRTELARRVGLAALARKRAHSTCAPRAAIELQPEDAQAPPPVTSEQLQAFMSTFAAQPLARPAPRVDDRPALRAFASNIDVAHEIVTPSAFDAEVDQLERATEEDRRQRWRRLSREGQVRWLSFLVAWAKALEADAARLGAPTHRLASLFRDLRAYSMEENPGFVHGFARTATPRSASWRRDAIGLLGELQPEKRAVEPVASAPRPQDDDDDDESAADDLADWPYRERAKGLRVVLFGGEPREERRAALEAAFQFELLDWVPTERPRQVASLAERAANGTVDVVLVTKFVAHKETAALSRSSRAPILVMRHGYGVTTVRQVLEEHFARMDAHAEPPPPA